MGDGWFIAAGPCRALSNITMRVNTSDVSSGTYVQVGCVQGYQLSPSQDDIFYCMDSVWNPHTPRCVEIQDPDVPVGIVVGCTIGGVLCLVVVLLAAYIMCRTREENQAEKQNDLLNNAKIMHLNFFMTSFAQDNVGMPAVLDDNPDDVDLRGVTSYDTTVGKVYRSSGSIFGVEDEPTGDQTNSKC